MKFLINLIKKPLGCILSLFIGLVMLVLVLGVVGVLLVDHYAVDIASRVLEQRTGFTMSVGQQDINAFGGSADLQNLQISNPDRFPSKEFMTLKEFKVKVDPASLLGKRIVVDEVLVDVDSATLVENKDGDINLLVLKDSLLSGGNAPAAGSSASSGPAIPPFLVKSFTLRINTIKFLDGSSGTISTVTQSVNYERTFTNVTEADVNTISSEVATDLSARGAAFVSQIAISKTVQGVSNAIKGIGNALKSVF
jgi:hypothetical protein